MIQPIKPMAKLAQKISTDTMGCDQGEEFELKSLAAIARRTEELGQLGRVFQRMVHEVYAREQRLKRQVQDLRIEIDEAKRVRQVAEIAQTDYFCEVTQRGKRD